MCDANTTFLCPACEFCPYPPLSHSCSHAKAVHLVDNGATVLFAVLMSFWAALFLEFW